MEIMDTEIGHGLPGIGQTKNEHFFGLKNILGSILKQITFLSQNGPKRYEFILLRTPS